MPRLGTPEVSSSHQIQLHVGQFQHIQSTSSSAPVPVYLPHLVLQFQSPYLIQCSSSSLPTSSSSIQTYINEINDHRQTSQGLQICFQLQLLLSLIFSEIGLTELYDAILKEIQKIYKVITFTLISDITLVWNDHTSFTKTIFT